jgi:hypothetical protein
MTRLTGWPSSVHPYPPRESKPNEELHFERCPAIDQISLAPWKKLPRCCNMVYADLAVRVLPVSCPLPYEADSHPFFQDSCSPRFALR